MGGGGGGWRFFSELPRQQSSHLTELVSEGPGQSRHLNCSELHESCRPGDCAVVLCGVEGGVGLLLSGAAGPRISIDRVLG